MTKKKPRGKPFVKGEDTRRKPAPVGNQYAKKASLSQQLHACLTEEVADPSDPEKKIERQALAVRAMVELAIKGEAWAQQFMWERMEGKVPNVTEGTVTQLHYLSDDTVKNLPDDELLALLKFSKRSLDAQGVKTIEHIPGDD